MNINNTNNNPFGLPSSAMKNITWPKGLLIGAGGLFATMLIILLALNLYTDSQAKQIIVLNDKIKEIQASFPSDKQAEVINFESRLQNLNDLLNNHRYLTQLFGNLETNTHPKVYLNNFNYDEASGLIKASGTAPNYTTVAEAVSGFVQAPGVENVVFDNLQIDNVTGKTTFSLQIKVNSSILKQLSNQT